jgi:hypothetical protein
VIAAVLALAGCVAALTGFIFWQGKELRSLRKTERSAVTEAGELKLLNAAAKVAVADKEKAMDLLIGERDNLSNALKLVKTQRDALLEKTLDHSDPTVLADAVRGALRSL